MLVLEQAGGKSFRKFSSLLRGFADEAEPGAPGQQLSMAFPSTPLPGCMAVEVGDWKNEEAAVQTAPSQTPLVRENLRQADIGSHKYSFFQ